MSILALVAFSLLDIRAVLSELGHNRLAVSRIIAEISADMAVFLVIEHLFHLLVERRVELSYHIVPYQFAVSDLVEILLDIGGEIISQDRVEILYQIIRYDHADFLREKLALFGADSLGLDSLGDFPVLHCQACDRNAFAFLVSLDDITASGGQCRDGLSVCGRTSDAELLKFLDQSRLGISCRRSRELAV